MVITPKNWPLFSVNFFVAITNVGQLGRIAYLTNTQGATAETTPKVVEVTSGDEVEAEVTPAREATLNA